MGRVETLECLIHDVDAFDRVDVAVHLEALVERCGQPFDLARDDDLVGDQDPIDPGLAHRLGLPRRGRGHRPCTVAELAPEECGRHGRLAVGRQRHMVALAEALHRSAVVVDRRVEHHRDRVRNVGIEDGPAGCGAGTERQPLRVVRRRWRCFGLGVVRGGWFEIHDAVAPDVVTMCA